MAEQRTIEHLVAEAAALAGGNLCASGHDWKCVGGRACPRHRDGSYHAEQSVYQCRRCGAYDYGEPGGPAHVECYVEGPCDWSCAP